MSNDFSIPVNFKILEGMYLQVNADIENLEAAGMGDMDQIVEPWGSTLRLIYDRNVAFRTSLRSLLGDAIRDKPDENSMELWPRSQLVEACHNLGYLEAETRGKSVKQLRDMVKTKQEAGTPVGPAKVAPKPLVKPPIGKPRLATAPPKPAVKPPPIGFKLPKR
jgi:hypothetical protein